MTPKIKTIITGATGMVGEGVLHEVLQHPAIESVLVINRKPCGVAPIIQGKLRLKITRTTKNNW
jgi:N-acetyl-gamma-glutamylphosphate reductase